MRSSKLPCGTVNFTVTEDYTRITEFKHLTGQTSAQDHHREGVQPGLRRTPSSQIPYYAIISEENNAHYAALPRAHRQSCPTSIPSGRLAEYRYYNMDVIVGRALALADQLVAATSSTVTSRKHGACRRHGPLGRARTRRFRPYEWEGTMTPITSYAVPCYNSAAYMDECIESHAGNCRGAGRHRGRHRRRRLHEGRHRRQKADAVGSERHPGVIRALHQPNGGHGSGRQHGHARTRPGLLLQGGGLRRLARRARPWRPIMAYLRSQRSNARHATRPRHRQLRLREGAREAPAPSCTTATSFPRDGDFTWEDCGHFSQSQYLLMHSVIYRTELLRDIDLTLPEHMLLRGQRLRLRAASPCALAVLPATSTCTATSSAARTNRSTRAS